MKPIVCLDVDDTLVDLASGWSAAIYRETGLHRVPSQWTTYNLQHVYPGLAMPDLLAILQHHRVLETAPLFPEVRAALQRLARRGLSIHLVTARGWHPDGLAITQQLCRQKALPVQHVHVLPLGACKARYLRQTFGRPPAAFVDDAPGQVAAMRQQFPAAAVFFRTQPWNHHLPGQHLATLSSLAHRRF